MLLSNRIKGRRFSIEPADHQQNKMKTRRFTTRNQIEEVSKFGRLDGTVGWAERDIQEQPGSHQCFDFNFCACEVQPWIKGKRRKLISTKNLIKQGRHPFLATTAVPLDFEIGDEPRRALRDYGC